MFRIPTVPTAAELLDRAFGRASRVHAADPERRYRLKKRSIARLQSASQALDAALGRVVKSFPSFDSLHPFHRELAAVVTDLDELRSSLAALDWARRKILELAGEELRRMRGSLDPETIERRRRAAYGRMSSVVRQVSGALERASEAREALKRLPSILPEAPTVVVAGYPNVGKSMLVGRLSSARPEVAPYPFTTKGILVGHMRHRWSSYQLIDTPGLLDRPLERRNRMELQAILALRHLADVILFLIDPTGECGATVEQQRLLLDRIRRDFPSSHLIEVASKADVMRRGEGIEVSALTGEGVEALRSMLIERLESLERGGRKHFYQPRDADEGEKD
ncbi:MAG: NOG1 family protein [Thermoplasmatota archaeon]